jgi:hypothetical protein
MANEMKLTHKFVASGIGILLKSFFDYVSWLLADILIEPSCCFWKCNRNSGWRIWNSQLGFNTEVHPGK